MDGSNVTCVTKCMNKYTKLNKTAKSRMQP
jgi:hypothetical protein